MKAAGRALFAAVREKLRPAALADAAAMARWADRQAAFIAQKCLMDYLRARLGTTSTKVLKEQMFIEVYDRCRWESWAAACSDLLVMAEAQWRAGLDSAAQRQLVSALGQVHVHILRDAAMPAHRTDWADQIEWHGARMAALADKPPAGPAQIALHTARRMHETLPINAGLRNVQDRQFIYGGVRMQAIQAWEELRRRAAPDLAVRLRAAA